MKCKLNPLTQNITQYGKENSLKKTLYVQSMQISKSTRSVNFNVIYNYVDTTNKLKHDFIQIIS